MSKNTFDNCHLQSLRNYASKITSLELLKNPKAIAIVRLIILENIIMPNFAVRLTVCFYQMMLQDLNISFPTGNKLVKFQTSTSETLSWMNVSAPNAYKIR
jgi:hypothetical protein